VLIRGLDGVIRSFGRSWCVRRCAMAILALPRQGCDARGTSNRPPTAQAF
jgi:hypothetical protein